MAGAAAGTVFEWYDFFLYGALAPVIAAQFFSAFGETEQTIFALLTFAAGFIVRPVGALVFGRLGDRVGRKHTFLATIVIMGLATFLVGLLPGYAEIGVAAPIALVVLRMLQGLAVGGEYGGAAIYVAEHAPPGRRGFFTSFVNLTSTLALLLALLVIIATQVATNAAYPPVTAPDGTSLAPFKAWGWRIPFLLSAVLLAISLYIRLQMNESPVFERMKVEGARSTQPLKEAFGEWRHARIGLIALFGLLAGQAVVWYTAHFYALVYLQSILKVDDFTAGVLLSWALLLGVPWVVVFAHISDRIGRKPVILGGCLLAALTYLPLFGALTKAASPALYEAQRSVDVVVIADPAECAFQFNPTGRAKFTSGCDRARALLAKGAVVYRTESAAPGPGAAVRIAGGEPIRVDDPLFTGKVTASITAAGYPAPADPSIVRIETEPSAGLANLARVFDIWDARKLTIIALLTLFIIYAAMTYGPIGAALVELFPARIRYSGVSLPYHIGNGWFGGLLPAITFAMVAATGDIYFGLAYPIAIAVLSVVVGTLLVPETFRASVADAEHGL
ncbi:MAG: MFS transporter [Hyphomicrobium sp.]|uniref:MFS transporter n=1 Tax=Hyphomicrobium sp. TaxID=82 RepID=UPI003D0D3F2F